MKMHRHFLTLFSYVPCKSSTRRFPTVLRDYSDDSKSRTKVIKLDSSDVSQLLDSKNIRPQSSSNLAKQENSSVSLSQESEDLVKSSSSICKASTKKKRSVKSDSKDEATKSTKIKKLSKSTAKAETSEQDKLSLVERYGDSIKMPGMKPLSVAKKKTKDTLTVAQESKNCGEIPSPSTESISPSTIPAPTFKDSIDIAEVIPRLRSPSLRLQKTLDVPSEWTSMGGSWTPSQEFLNSIMNFPIRGLEKSIDITWKDTEHVACFVTANKTAAKVVPAVTTVLSKTMTPAQAFALKLWRERLTKELGEEGFQQHRAQILLRGKQFHETIQQYLHGESVQNLNIENQPLISGCWRSLVPILNQIDDVIAVESEVLHPRLFYRGIIDCIVEIKGKPFIVEWKHSTGKKRTLQRNYDSPVQLMAYTGAINSNASYPFAVKNSLLVVAYEDGSPADVFLLSDLENGEQHWNTWLKRLHSYWTLHKAEKDLGE